MKNSNDNIGNRTRDLPAFSAVPQQTAPSRAPADTIQGTYAKKYFFSFHPLLNTQSYYVVFFVLVHTFYRGRQPSFANWQYLHRWSLFQLQLLLAADISCPNKRKPTYNNKPHPTAAHSRYCNLACQSGQLIANDWYVALNWKKKTSLYQQSQRPFKAI